MKIDSPHRKSTIASVPITLEVKVRMEVRGKKKRRDNQTVSEMEGCKVSEGGRRQRGWVER